MNACFVIKRLAAPGLALCLALWIAGPAVAANACNASPMWGVASIERIEPPGEPVQVRAADGSTRRAALFECLVTGEQLVLQGRVTMVELFIAGAPRSVSVAESPFRIEGGFANQVSAISKAVSQWWTLHPHETGSAVVRPRTKSNGELQVTPGPGLAQAPRQWLLEGGTSAVVAWRASQTAAWTALAAVDGSAAVAKGRVGEAADGNYAVFEFEPRQATDRPLTFRVLDDRQRVVVTVAAGVSDGAALPRPEGLDGDWHAWPDESRIVWAVWALREGPPEWQLQALSWLQRYQRQSWLAGHVFYRGVNGTLETPRR